MTNGRPPTPGKPPKDPAVSARTSAIAAVVAAAFAGVSAVSAVPTLLSYLHIEILKPINYEAITRSDSTELVRNTDGENKFNIYQKSTVKIRNKSDKPITVNFSGYSPDFELKRGDNKFPSDGLTVEPYKTESFEIRVNRPLDYATNLALDNLFQKNDSNLISLIKYLRTNNIDLLTLRKGYSNYELSRCFNSESEMQSSIYKKPHGDDKFFGLGFELSVEGIGKSDTKFCYIGALSSEPG